MKKKTATDILNYLQCLYQQKMITKDEKDKIAQTLLLSMRNNNPLLILEQLKCVKPLTDEAGFMLASMINLVKENEHV